VVVEGAAGQVDHLEPRRTEQPSSR
jgi:hypothetical protein